MIKPIKVKHTITEDGVETNKVYIVSVSSAEIVEKLNEVIEQLNKLDKAL